MRTRNLFALALAIALAGSWLSIVLLPSTQYFMNSNIFWNGIRDFVTRFDADPSFDNIRLESTPIPAAAGTDINVLVEIPLIPYQTQELKRLGEFVNNGGTLLILDDFAYGNQILEGLGLTVRFSAVPLLDPYMAYRNQAFPVVTDIAPELQATGIKELILNHPTSLSFYSGMDGYDILARSSDVSFLDYNGNGARDGVDAKGPFAVAARIKVGSGTVVVVSDPGILINSMVKRADNQKFLEHLIAKPGTTPRVALDSSHLPKTPMDVTKGAWESIRQRLAMPYSQTLVTAVVIMLSFLSLWKSRTLSVRGKNR